MLSPAVTYSAQFPRLTNSYSCVFGCICACVEFTCGAQLPVEGAARLHLHHAAVLPRRPLLLPGVRWQTPQRVSTVSATRQARGNTGQPVGEAIPKQMATGKGNWLLSNI